MVSVEIRVLLSDSAHKFRRKNAGVPNFYLSSPDAAGISQTEVLNQIDKTKEREIWVPFKT